MGSIIQEITLLSGTSQRKGQSFEEMFRRGSVRWKKWQLAWECELLTDRWRLRPALWVVAEDDKQERHSWDQPDLKPVWCEVVLVDAAAAWATVTSYVTSAHKPSHHTLIIAQTTKQNVLEELFWTSIKSNPRQVEKVYLGLEHSGSSH